MQALLFHLLLKSLHIPGLLQLLQEDLPAVLRELVY